MVGDYIRGELEKRNWTQTVLAYVMGRPVSYVNRIVNGKCGITPRTAHDLADAFGASVTEILRMEARRKLSQLSPLSEQERARIAMLRAQVERRRQTEYVPDYVI